MSFIIPPAYLHEQNLLKLHDLHHARRMPITIEYLIFSELGDICSVFAGF